MKPNRRQRCLTAWMLCISVLCAGLACAGGHARAALPTVAGQALAEDHCAHAGHAGQGSEGSHASAPTPAPGGSVCVLGSLFGAGVLAAFFGLFGLLASLAIRPPPSPGLPRLPRYRWPAANPRASPFQSLIA